MYLDAFPGKDPAFTAVREPYFHRTVSAARVQLENLHMIIRAQYGDEIGSRVRRRRHIVPEDMHRAIDGQSVALVGAASRQPYRRQDHQREQMNASTAADASEREPV